MATTLASGHDEVVEEEEEMAGCCYLLRMKGEGEEGKEEMADCCYLLRVEGAGEEGKEERFLGFQCCQACLLQEKRFLVLRVY